MDRLSKEKDRFRKQTKRINQQAVARGHSASKDDPDIIRRSDTELTRIRVQRERVRGQRNDEDKRIGASRLRREAITGMDELERQKIARQKVAGGKGDRRRAKWGARSRKYERRI